MICPRCGERECITRGNGRGLPACSECWATRDTVGTRRQNARGYWRVKVAGGWRFEHILLAESALGRPLHSDEHVAWADGDRSNNDPSNLMIGVTRFKPLVEAPKRPKDRTGEKHTERTEVRLHPLVRQRFEQEARETGQTVAAVTAAYATSAAMFQDEELRSVIARMR